MKNLRQPIKSYKQLKKLSDIQNEKLRQLSFIPKGPPIIEENGYFIYIWVGDEPIILYVE